MAAFVRMVFDDFTIEEELLKITPLIYILKKTCILIRKSSFLLRKFKFQKW
nr:unnamed protein product [Callosobruchus chinensis]